MYLSKSGTVLSEQLLWLTLPFDQYYALDAGNSSTTTPQVCIVAPPSVSFMAIYPVGACVHAL